MVRRQHEVRLFHFLYLPVDKSKLALHTHQLEVQDHSFLRHVNVVQLGSQPLSGPRIRDYYLTHPILLLLDQGEVLCLLV